MILWKFKEHLETRGEEMPCRAFRWVLEIGHFYFGLVAQHQFRGSSEWHDSHVHMYQVCITKHWALGLQHVYYDGMHCSFSIGPIHFNWGY
jgi:hypothetical protein